VKRRVLVAVLLVLTLGAGAFYVYGRGIWYPLYVRIAGVPARSVADVLALYGKDSRARLRPSFDKAGVSYPPKRVALLIFKKERRVALWAKGTGEWRYIRDYPIHAASGHAGPKLREGDYQVPEGVYAIEHLNPNSTYHLSMKVGYPNAFDRQMAARDRRTRLGGDIFIHGKNLSIGCVAVGDTGIEELFTLVAETGNSHVQVIIAPNDLRTGGAIIHRDAPPWVGQLYRTVAAALREFPVQAESGSSMNVRGMSKVLPRFK
jgi:hypothetical protein